MIKQFIVSAALVVGTAGASFAQGIVTPQPSPLCKVEQRVGITDFTLTYSRPSVKGRKIFGDLEEFGKIWRFGANSPTKLKFTDSAKVGNTWLAPGEYALYAMPAQTGDWTIYVGKDTRVQAGEFKPADAAATIMAKPETLPMNVETFTLEFTDLTTTTANLTMMWEKTAVRIPITVEVDRKVMANISKVMGDVSPYYAAASYYYETGRDPKQAIEWVDKTLEKSKGYWIYLLKARLQLKAGDKAGAIATAETAKTKAKEAGNTQYVKMSEKLIADAKAGK